MPKDTQRTARIDPAQLDLPERVTVAVAELASAAREGCWPWRWGTGLQVLQAMLEEDVVLQAMLEEDVARLVGPKAATTPTGRRSATAPSPAR